MNEVVCQILDGSIEPLEALRLLGGYYQCPKRDGKRLGPLVGYAGKDKLDRQLVGEAYVNVAVMEEWPAILQHYCVDLIHGQTPNFNCCCGAPEGGKSIAMILARSYPRDTRYIYPEKKVTALATKNQREQSELVWSRHQPNQGDRVILCEDVCNNFSTTKKLIELIEKIKDAGVVAIACFLNRSTTISDNFEYNGRLLPILAVVRKPMPEWKQDDPEIECDVAYGNVVWKPKDDWPRLMRIMANF